MRASIFLLLVSFTTSLFGQGWIPWNPDYNCDEVIGTADLLGVLSVFGEEFVLDVPDEETHTLALQPAGILPYYRCEGYCHGIGGHVATLTELAVFPDSLLWGLGDTIPTGNSYYSGTSYGEVIHLNVSHQRQYWRQIVNSTDATDLYYFRYKRSFGYGSTESGDESESFSPWQIQGQFPLTSNAGCICAGRILN